MPEAANHTPPVPSAPAVPVVPAASSAAAAAAAPYGPAWLVFCVMACSAFAALLGRLAHFHHSSSSTPSPDSTGDLSADHPFAFILHLIAIDWFRRSRTAPATPEQLLRRSTVARALLGQPLHAPVLPCDLPGQPVTPGTFAPAFAGQLAAASSTPLSLTPTSFLNAYLGALSPRSRVLFDNEADPDDSTTPLISYSALDYSAFRILHSAFPFAPV